MTASRIRRPAFLLACTVLYFLGTAARASWKPFWYDELWTFHMSQLPGAASIVRTMSATHETMPPLLYILTHATGRIFGYGEVGLRVPEMVGFWIMCLALFSLVERHASGAAAATAMLFPCFTGVYEYAYEARPYGVLLGLYAIALVCWQRATGGTAEKPRTWWLTGFAVSLLGVIHCHFYGVLLLGPLGLAEAVRLVRRRRPDWPLWAILAACPATLLAYRALLAPAAQQAVKWARPEPSGLPDTYQLFQVAWIPVLGFLVCLAAGMARGLPAEPGGGKAPGWSWSKEEGWLAVAIAFVPVGTLIFAGTVSGMYSNRYALAAVIGFSLLAGMGTQWSGLCRGKGGARLVTLCVAGSFAIEQIFSIGMGYASSPEPPSYPEPAAGPIVVTDSRLLVEMMHYATPALKDHLLYLTDDQAALQYNHHKAGEEGLRVFGLLAPVPVAPYRTWVEAHRRFRLFGRWGSAFDWIGPKLLDDGATLRFLGQYGPYRYFEVSWPGPGG